MNNMPMNFTGKCKLDDSEFLEFYEQLWKKTPREKLPETDIKAKKQKGEERYNSEKASLLGEEWSELPNNKHYSISTMGRVKYKGKFVQQDDRAHTGYLKLDVNREKNVDHSVNVYTLVAKTFLGKRDGDGYEVHHIDNNGYDNRPQNLILLTSAQHHAVHSKEKLSQEELAALLEQTVL